MDEKDLLLVLIFGIAGINGFEYNVKLTNISCHKIGNKVGDFECSWKQFDRTTYLVQMHLNLTEEIDDLKMQIVLFYKYKSGYQQFFINSTEDFCEYSSGKPNSIIDIVFHKAKQDKMVNARCPIQKGIFGFNYFPIEINSVLLGMIPTGYYKLEVMMFSHGKKFFFFRTYTQTKFYPTKVRRDP